MADFKVRATERYSYGHVDHRAVYGTLDPAKADKVAISGTVLRTIVGVTVAGHFYAKHPPIEQDWDHVAELLTVEEEKPDGREDC